MKFKLMVFFLNLFFKRQNQERRFWRQHKLIRGDVAGECCILQGQVGVSLHQERNHKLPFQISQGIKIYLT